MSVQTNAENAYNVVRQRYRTSYKSSNKWYFDANGLKEKLTRGGEQVSRDDFERLNSEQISRMFDATGNGKDEAVDWSVMDQIFKWGNCEELCKLIMHQLRLNGARGTTAGLEEGDHVFVLVGDIKDTNRVHQKSVSDLNRLNDIDVWAADVWLGICCHIKNYPEKVESKLKKWQSQNKRIYWLPPGSPDDALPSWSVAAGDNADSNSYDNVFLRSKIVIADISREAWQK